MIPKHPVQRKIRVLSLLGSDEAQRGVSGLRDDQSGSSLASGNTRSTATVTCWLLLLNFELQLHKQTNNEQSTMRDS